MHIIQQRQMMKIKQQLFHHSRQLSQMQLVRINMRLNFRKDLCTIMVQELLMVLKSMLQQNLQWMVM